MLKIRLQRVGRKNDPSFRIVLIDARQGPKSGKFIENLGFYDAIRKIKQVKGDKIKHWIANGAQVSDTVHNILIGEKIIAGKKINVLPGKTPLKKETEKKEDKQETKENEKKAEQNLDKTNTIPEEEKITGEQITTESKKEQELIADTEKPEK